MPDWLTAFLTKYGLTGALVLIILALVAGPMILPQLQTILTAAPPEKATPATHEQMVAHIQQTKAQTDLLTQILQQLRANHDTQAAGSMLICLRLSKTDEQRDKCVELK